MCSDHCVDGESTVTYSFPEQKHGYENATEKRASEAPRSDKES